MSATTAFAKIKSVDEVGLDTNPDLLTQWVTKEFTKGRAAHQAFLDKGHRLNRSTWSEPFAAGFAFDEAWVADPADPWLDEANAADDVDFEVAQLDGLGRPQARVTPDDTGTAAVLAESYVNTIAARRSETTAAATALIDDSQTASMHPLVAHYASEALSEAMAVVEQYGRWSPDGAFRPFIIDDFDAAARQLGARQGSGPDAVKWGYDQVIEALHAKLRLVNKTNDVLLNGRGRIDLQFEINNDTERFGPTMVYEVGVPQIIFMIMGEHTKAYKRGERVWALYYTPDVNMVADRHTGEMLPRSGWYNPKGWAGVVKTFADYDDAKDAARALAQALRTIRDTDAERVRDAAANEAANRIDEILAAHDLADARLRGESGEVAPEPRHAAESAL